RLEQPSELAFRVVIGSAPRLPRRLDPHLVAAAIVLHLDDVRLPAGAFRVGQDPIETTVDVELPCHPAIASVIDRLTVWSVAPARTCALGTPLCIPPRRIALFFCRKITSLRISPMQRAGVPAPA